MITELFGLPGAGKTTLAKKLEAEEGFKIIKINNKKELLYFNFIHVFKYPVGSSVNLFFIIKNSPNQKLFYYKFMNFFMDINARYEKAGRCDKSILDQGYFQNILSVFEKPITRDLLKRYLKYLPKPDKLIIIDISFEESLNRIQKRGYYAREKFGKDYVENWRKTILSNYNLFKEEAVNCGIKYDIL